MKNKMKNSNKSSKKLLSLLALAGVLTLGSITASSFAEEGGGGGYGGGERWAPQFNGRDAHASRRGYFLGICVGQTLAQQGITVTPGQQPDSTTEAAMKSAVETCRAEMRAGASPSPSGAPSTTPSGEPSTNPAPTETTIPAPTSS